MSGESEHLVHKEHISNKVKHSVLEPAYLLNPISLWPGTQGSHIDKCMSVLSKTPQSEEVKGISQAMEETSSAPPDSSVQYGQMELSR